MLTKPIRILWLVSKRRLHQQQHHRLLVSTQWLDDQLTAKNEQVRLVHASFDECIEFKRGHIRSALCFNGIECRDRTSPYHNIFPTPAAFEKYVNERLLISKDDHVVVYDDDRLTPSLNTGSRVWFMFYYFGHDKVSLLDGGYQKWFSEGRPIEQNNKITSQQTRLWQQRQAVKGKFVATPRSHLMITYEQMVNNVHSKESQVVDARVPKRFMGIADPLGKPGRIPNAINTPLAAFVDPSSKTLLNKEQLENVFRKAGVDLKKPLIAYCGSGVTACTPIFAAHLCGKDDVRLYNGSWCEWNQRASDDLIIKDR